MQPELQARPVAPPSGPASSGGPALLRWAGARKSRKLAACIDCAADADKVIAHSEAIAAALGTPLALVHVIEPAAAAGRPPDPLDWSLRRHKWQDRLRQLAKQSRPAVGPVENFVLEGAPAAELCQLIGGEDIGMVALATRCERSGGPGSLGSTAARVLELTHCSVLLVPPEASERAVYKRILVPLDGSLRAESVLPFATAIAVSQGAEILVAHVVPEAEVTEVGPLELEAVELSRKLFSRNERVGRAYLARILKRLRDSGVSARIVMAKGDARDCVRQLTQGEAADLVLLSAQGHGGRPDAPCGKVTGFLACHTAIPLLVVRNDDEGRPVSSQAVPQPAS